MTSYSEEIDFYSRFDDNPTQCIGDIEKTQQEQEKRLKSAIPDLFPWLEIVEQNPEMKDRLFEMILNQG